MYERLDQLFDHDDERLEIARRRENVIIAHEKVSRWLERYGQVQAVLGNPLQSWDIILRLLSIFEPPRTFLIGR